MARRSRLSESAQNLPTVRLKSTGRENSSNVMIEENASSTMDGAGGDDNIEAAQFYVDKILPKHMCNHFKKLKGF